MREIQEKEKLADQRLQEQLNNVNSEALLEAEVGFLLGWRVCHVCRSVRAWPPSPHVQSCMVIDVKFSFHIPARAETYSC